MNAETILSIAPGDGAWYVLAVDGTHRKVAGWALVRMVDEDDDSTFEVVRALVPNFDPNFSDGLVQIDECIPADELECIRSGRCQGHTEQPDPVSMTRKGIA